MPGGGGGGGGDGGSSHATTSGVAPSHPTSYAQRPGPHDVLCGRGGKINKHVGNVNFRKLVAEHKMRYLAASKAEKPRVAREVVRLWRALDPPGRFLARTGGAKAGLATATVKAEAEDALWRDVGDGKAREKASQCLRERTPDVIPYARKLQAGRGTQKQQQRWRRWRQSKWDAQDHVLQASVVSPSLASAASDGSTPGAVVADHLASSEFVGFVGHDDGAGTYAYGGGHHHWHQQMLPTHPYLDNIVSAKTTGHVSLSKQLEKLRRQQRHLQEHQAYLEAQQRRLASRIGGLG